jgi:hypothetical protein
MRVLLATTGLGAIATALAITPVHAETVISTAITTPVATGTANDDLRISSTGSIKPTSGAAVTINSNDNVSNQGTIAIKGANNATGILANTNLTSDITNSGTITIDEDFTPTDTDSDGDIDGPFAQGSNRFGIHVLGGGTFTGTVINTGTISIEGNDSAGIAIDSVLAGNVLNSGNIGVLGNNSVGLRTGDVNGNVSLIGGSIVAQGQNAVGVDLAGDILGAVKIQGIISTTGYRSTTAPADTSKLDADDLLQGGPAVIVAGNVGGGILLDAPPPDLSSTDADEDDDGVPDAQEPTASLASIGAAPALLIGSTTADTSIGAVASSSSGLGLIVRGSVVGSGVYTGVDATGISIGGLGHSVSIAGGMSVSGSVTAKAVEGDATAIHLGAGASVPLVDISGSILANGAGVAGSAAQAILIDAGANVGTIKNSGTIIATRSGDVGTAAAIVDKSGSVSLVENKGVIGVTDAVTLGDSATAIDLSANNAGATVRQLAPATGASAPQINGRILFGSGSDVLEILAGNVTGGVNFGGGSDALTVSGGGTFAGAITGSSGLAVTIGAGSTLTATNTGPVGIASLDVAAGGNLGVTLNTLTNSVTLYDVAGAASFGDDSKIIVNLQNVGGVAGTYKIIQAGSLTGADNLTSNVALLPFLFTSSLVTSVPGEVSLKVDLKSADQLGLNASEGAILGAALTAADLDSPIAGIFLRTADSASLSSTLQQLLPEEAGGVFENVTKGSRLVAGILADPHASVTRRGGLGLWLEQVAWGSAKSIGATSSYNVDGWGAAAGVEHGLGGFGAIGLSAAYYHGRDTRHDNELANNHYEGGVYWRGGVGPFHAFARATAGHITFDGRRQFSGTLNGEAVTRIAEGKWNGNLFSAVGGVSYEVRSGRLSFRPSASIEHFRLKEKGYSETGGGDAFDLTVANRSSDETAANGLLAVGYDFMGLKPEEAWLRLELEGGRREIVSGSLGATTASFNDGDPFTLAADQRTSGWRGGLRLTGGGSGVGFTAEASGEEQQGKASIGGRIGISFAL